MFDTSTIAHLVRPNILALRPYSSARDEYKAVATGQTSGPAIFLDANENSLGGPLDEDFSRYPDPGQWDLKSALAGQRQLDPEQIFLGNGSDEAIDLLIRAFCAPGRDEIVILPPTYGMYAVQAAIQDALICEVPLRSDFTPDMPAILAIASERSKLLFLCSPNNPSGNRFPETDIREILEHFPGVVVVDEAYIDFAEGRSCTEWIAQYPNLVVLQTFSKAWGLAGLRIGMAFSNTFIISILNKIKYPYNLNVQTTTLALQALQRREQVLEKVAILLQERSRLADALRQVPCVEHVFPSDANFLLVKVRDANLIYQYLCMQNIVVRNRTNTLHCADCLRITIGTPEENERLLEALRFFN